MSSQTCAVCSKTVYPLEMVTVGPGVHMHDRCFKCSHCKRKLAPGNYTSVDTKLFCNPHYDQLFKLRGNLDLGVPATCCFDLISSASASLELAQPISVAQDIPTTSPPTNSTPTVTSVSVKKKPAPPETYPDLALPTDFGAQWMALIQIDKPLYNPGDPLRTRVVLLDSVTLNPCPPGSIPYVSLKILNAANEAIMTQHAMPSGSLAFGCTWSLPQSLPGGDYKVVVSPSRPTILSVGERTFEVREFSNPKFKKQLEFVKKGLGLGDVAEAKLEVTTSEGDIPLKANIEATARIDGAEVFKGNFKLEADGSCLITFRIPTELEKGEGSLNVSIDDGGVTESIGATIPIILTTIDFSAFPESGNPVVGLHSSVYFLAKTATGAPADLSGKLVSHNSTTYDPKIPASPLSTEFTVISSVATIHEGRGRLELTPEEGKTYYIQAEKPSGISYLIPLNLQVEKSGALVTCPEAGVQKPTDKTLTLAVQSTYRGSFILALYKKYQEMSFVDVDITESNKVYFVTCPLPSYCTGVIRAALLDQDENPISERLIFQYPKRYIRCELSTDKPSYKPGEKVRLTISTFDRTNKPVAAYVGIAVTDDSVLEAIERRKQQPRLREMALLESEVAEFFDSPVYLRGDAKGHVATDLLLGVQGWRRFVYFKTQKELLEFVEQNQGKLHIERLFSRSSSQAPELLPLAPKIYKEKDGSRPRAKISKEQDGSKTKKKMASRGCGVGRRSEIVPTSSSMCPRNRKTHTTLSPGRKSRLSPDFTDFTDFSTEFGLKVSRGRIPSPAHILKNTRSVFSDTIYWNPYTLVKGHTVIKIRLPDNITSFKAQIDAFNKRDLFGACDLLIRSSPPFAIEPKLPKYLSVNDVLMCPLVLTNNTAQEMKNASVNLTLLKPLPKARFLQTRKRYKDDLVVHTEASIHVPAQSRVRTTAKIDVQYHRSLRLLAHGQSGEEPEEIFTDKVYKKVKVSSLGFPSYFRENCQMKNGETKEWICDIPESADSIYANFAFSSSPAKTILDTAQHLVRRPHGCFEQAGATLFPGIFALKILRQQKANSLLTNRAETFIREGYAILSKYESKTGGFEWYGADPGHEVLTAYAILLFHFLDDVYKVDKALVQRTRAWLLSRRNGKGRFDQRTPKYAHSHPDRNVAQAYILWALTIEPSNDNLDLEINAAFKTAMNSSDSYLVAVTALVLINVNRRDDAEKLIPKLIRNSQGGKVTMGKETIVRSEGLGTDLQTTAFAVLVWVNFDREKYATNIEESIAYLMSTWWDSSQSNTMCVMAYYFAQCHKTSQEPKTPAITLTCDEHSFTAKITRGTLTMPDISQYLTPGSHKISINIQGIPGGTLWSEVRYSSLLPNNHPECKVSLKVELSKGGDSLTEGDATEVNVEVKNVTDQPLPMVTAQICIPGGFEPRHEKLKELVKTGKVDHYEIFKGRDIVFYWRGFSENGIASFSFDVVALVPGTFNGAASLVYLYYTPAAQYFAAGLKVEIAPKEFKNDPITLSSEAFDSTEPPAPLDYYSSGNSINEFYTGVNLEKTYGEAAPADDLSAFYGGMPGPSTSFEFILS